ncbi:MAG: class I tRNA ligase family protein [Patescibacteria group bacterium]|nr:class I tRNA ligase family protein [Patescibacteria group bacterium]
MTKKKNSIPKYNFRSIEKKWQKQWEEKGVYRPDPDKAKRPFYNLMMFPYPSAEGLHVGNTYAFTGADVYGRFKKLQGFDVFEPIGLDGFGIHSENYAMKIGEHIKDVSKRSEKNFYRQLHEIGNMYDWSRTVETYKPEYYKWTQWLFLQMFKSDLAYQKKAKVNWCPLCKTVLSDEQVIAGECERCDSTVEKKELKQWFFSITKYADKLLKNLDWIDWPSDVKTNQKNWIGKSVGAEVYFEIKKSGEKISVFTTRPDTLFGATYLVVAPEHSLLKSEKSKIKNQKEVFGYVERALKKTEQQRKNEEKVKTGVELKGVNAINPVNGEEIPVWVADYVLAEYGTGAIMAVPAHDERDFEFAKKFGLSIRQVVAPFYKVKGKDVVKNGKLWTRRNIVNVVVKHWKDDKYLMINRKGQEGETFVLGSAKDGEDFVKVAQREVREETGYKNLIFKKQLGGKFVQTFYANHKGVSRFGVNNSFYFELKNGAMEKMSEKEQAKHEVMWVSKKDVSRKLKIENHIKTWNRFLGKENENCFVGEGVSVNSEYLNDLKTADAKKEIIGRLTKKKQGKKTVDFKLRDWCISRQRYWGPPIPVVHCKGCALKKEKIKVLLVHGFGVGGDSNWFGWMKKELKKIGCEVFSPSLPKSNDPSLSWWLSELKKYSSKLDEKSLIISHSLGSRAVAHLLAGSKNRIGKWISVAGAFGDEERKDRGKNFEKFVSKKIEWKKVDEKIDQVHFVLSKDDRWIDTKHHEKIKLSNQINTVWEGYSHFAKKKYPHLRDYIVDALFEDVEPIAVPVSEKDLPVKLPPMEDFLPEGKGKGPLAKNEKFVNTKCPVCGGQGERETDVSDPFVDSSWYFFRYLSTEFHDKVFDKKRTKKWLPVDSYIGGKEHTVLHLLYSRFVTMVLNDLGYIDFDEPYKRFFGHGLITKDGAKMSKSKGNVINPDDMIKKYGADSMRLYLRFLGDFSQGGCWRDSGIEGMSRFVNRMWKVFYEIQGEGKGVKIMSMTDKTIKVVEEDLEKLSFNTAVARIMEFVNWAKENKTDFDKVQAVKVKESLAFIISPFAPHVAEEFWSQLSHKRSIFESLWPKFDPKNVFDEQIEIVVQVNGKVRDRLIISRDVTEDEVRVAVLESEKVQKYVGDKKVKKLIYISGRLMSVVV